MVFGCRCVLQCCDVAKTLFLQWVLLVLGIVFLAMLRCCENIVLTKVFIVFWVPFFLAMLRCRENNVLTKVSSGFGFRFSCNIAMLRKHCPYKGFSLVLSAVFFLHCACHIEVETGPRGIGVQNPIKKFFVGAGTNFYGGPPWRGVNPPRGKPLV